MREPYSHKRNEVDDVIQALSKLEREQGTAAARAAIPEVLHPAIHELEKINKIGFILATEIALRTALKVEAMS